ncbi:MAG: leucine-rich repeat protein [Oscillospiraceae bacterium]
MKKKLLGLILALLMVFSLLPASAFAANDVQSGNCGKDLTWTLDDEGVLTITGTGEMTGAPWSDYKDSIKSVVIGDGVSRICDDAFRECSEMTEIIIPNSVTQIGSYAFLGCSGLKGISLPGSVKKIELGAFAGCKGLTEITIPSGITEIPSEAFSSCKGLKSVTIPSGVKTIGLDAFYYCSGLTEINISNGVETIGNSAFSNCTGLKKIIIPESVKYIQSAAFAGCTALTSIVIPGNVAGIDDSVFANCTGLKSAAIKCNITALPYATFSGCSSLESVSIPGSVKEIRDNAFAGCDALKDVYFGGTDMQWLVMPVGDDNEALDSVTVYCAIDYPFTDIADSGYRDYISFGQAVGIVNGYPDGTFRPRNTVTRAQYITMLYNMCGKPDVSGYSLNFKDKNSISGAYMDAVKWGVATGIVSGYGDNTFRPNQEITRAQMATFSYRLMKLVIGGEPDAELKADCGFKDSASIANVYKEAVNVMANLGIITGFDTDNDGVGDTFRPSATANRGQAATIIVRVAISLGMDS